MAGRPPNHGKRPQEVNLDNLEAPMPSREDEDEEEEEEEETEQPQEEEEKGGGDTCSTDSFTFDQTRFEMIKRPYKDIEDSSNLPETVKKMKEESSGSGQKDTFLEGLMIDVNREIAFLNNLVEYHSRNLVYPFENSLALEDYIKEWLKVDVPKDKLMEKINLLKRKYREEAGRITAFGPREQEAMELCKKIWGTTDERATGGGDSPIMNLTSLAEKHQSVSTSDFDGGGTATMKKMKEKEKGATSGDKDHVTKFLERLAGDDVNADVAFLNELVEYHSNNLIYPFENFLALDDFIKDWLKVNVPKDKMREIIDGLRRKYGKMGKMADLGTRQQEAIKLVKKIWPNEIETQNKDDEEVKESPKDGSEHDSS